MNLKFTKKNFIFHPFLFAMFPVLFLYSHNISLVYFSEILVPCLLSLIFTGVIYAITTLVMSNIYKSSLITSCFVLLFFSYGHFREYLLSLHKYFFLKYTDYFLFFIYILLSLIITFSIYKTKSKLIISKKVLNIVSFSLILITSFPIIKLSKITNHSYKIPIEKINLSSENNPKNLPDIYFIVLDGYAGKSTLKNIYNFDNSKFLNKLKSKNFIIPQRSISNYGNTLLSLTSSLNMRYINNLINTNNHNKKNIENIFKLLTNNQVIMFLKKLNYTTVHIRSRATYTSTNPYADINIDTGLLDDFKFVFIKTTILAPFADYLGFYNLFRKRILNIFRTIPEIAKIKKPTFTFAHIMVPHPPYLFRKNGFPRKQKNLLRKLTFKNKKKYYIEQLRYTNVLVESLINKIIYNSKQVPIIIIQSDHGPKLLLEKVNYTIVNKQSLNERFYILNALLLPGKTKKQVPKFFTPVNTFRVIFNQYFNLNLNLLKNQSYFSTPNDQFNLHDITEELK